MPNWKTHLEVSNRINKVYRFEGIDFKKFLIGSILPDINNSHIVKDISTKLYHEVTHYHDEAMPSYLVFYNKYKEQIEKRDPLFVGVVTHLYTDYTWNGNFYTNVAKRNYPETDRTKLRIMKQSDFQIFNNKFEKNFINVVDEKEIEELCEDCKKISEVSLILDDIRRVIEFLKIENFCDANLQFYTIEELDELLEKTVERLSKK